VLNQLQQQYDTLEEARLTLIQKVRDLSPALLNHKPGPDRWSILEDFQHLVLAEQRTALEVGTALEPEEKNPDMLDMVLQVLDQDVIVDVPDPGMVPDGDAALEDLIQDWELSRKHLFEFLESCRPEDLQRQVSRHPVTGPLSVVDSLRLITSHFEHHRRRIEKAIKEL